MTQIARQITAPPPAARALCTLERIDYADAFLVDLGPAREGRPEAWARAVLEDAPLAVRGQLTSGWRALGLKVGSGRADDAVLGWGIRESTDDFVLLAADSRVGMPGQLLFKREGDSLLFATFVQHSNPLARAVWAATVGVHVATVRRLLEQAAERWGAGYEIEYASP